ncbi:hypothetical protein NPIL_395761 [Nephila pilipes]|uniref:Uncharacterized protein n=1 Tax=Nephila pilipes TaxID=299642 RepID=A0A8X6P5S2_NEPPI|nr:hypothetical protein NPIL_395761 [Nephila pilipes]
MTGILRYRSLSVCVFEKKTARPVEWYIIQASMAGNSVPNSQNRRRETSLGLKMLNGILLVRYYQFLPTYFRNDCRDQNPGMHHRDTLSSVENRRDSLNGCHLSPDNVAYSKRCRRNREAQAMISAIHLKKAEKLPSFRDVLLLNWLSNES